MSANKNSHTDSVQAAEVLMNSALQNAKELADSATRAKESKKWTQQLAGQREQIVTLAAAELQQKLETQQCLLTEAHAVQQQQALAAQREALNMELIAKYDAENLEALGDVAQHARCELRSALKEQQVKIIAGFKDAHAAAEQRCQHELSELASNSSTDALVRHKEQVARATSEQYASNIQDKLAATHATQTKETSKTYYAMESAVRQQIAAQSAAAKQQAFAQRAEQLRHTAQQTLASYQAELAKRADAEQIMQLHAQACEVNVARSKDLAEVLAKAESSATKRLNDQIECARVQAAVESKAHLAKALVSSKTQLDAAAQERLQLALAQQHAQLQAAAQAVIKVEVEKSGQHSTDQARAEVKSLAIERQRVLAKRLSVEQDSARNKALSSAKAQAQGKQQQNVAQTVAALKVEASALLKQATLAQQEQLDQKHTAAQQQAVSHALDKLRLQLQQQHEDELNKCKSAAVSAAEARMQQQVLLLRQQLHSA